MKHTLLLLMTFSLLTFTSCSNDDDNPSGSGVSAGTITAKIDGTTFTNTNGSGQATLAQLSTGDNLVINGSNSSGKSINLIIWNYTGTGTYFIDNAGANPNTALYTETDINNPTNTQIWQAPYLSSPQGFIKITEDTGSIVKGEFELKAQNPRDNSIKNITVGQFNLTKI